MKQLLYTSILCSFIMLCVSCGDDNLPLQNTGLDYLPLEVGNFWEYKVDSLLINDSNTKIFASSFVKETITEKITDGSGNVKYLYEKSWKRNETDPYQIVNVYSFRVQNGSIFRNEENLEFLTIQAPIRVNDCWDGILFDEKLIVTVSGNSIEQYKAWNFKVLNEFNTETIGDFEYDRVMTVQQADDENAIERRFSREKYQYGVGMIERRQIIADTQCIAECVGESWEDKADKGFLAVTTLISHN